jgi:ADP-ribosylglycohydrolase
MAAAVAAAFCPDASVASILDAAVAYLPQRSANVMRRAIEAALQLAQQTGEYEAFRERYYKEQVLPGAAMPDARETVPVTYALFYLAGGDPGQVIQYGANFGRDADTIASMAGALAGAFRGAAAFPGEWTQQIRASGGRDQTELTRLLVEVIYRRSEDQASIVKAIRSTGDGSILG